MIPIDSSGFFNTLLLAFLKAFLNTKLLARLTLFLDQVFQVLCQRVSMLHQTVELILVHIGLKALKSGQLSGLPSLGVEWWEYSHDNGSVLIFKPKLSDLINRHASRLGNLLITEHP